MLEYPTQASMKSALRNSPADLPDFNVAVCRNIMVEPLAVPLRYYMLQEGYNCQVTFGNYNTMQQEALGASDDGLFANKQAILVFTYLPTLEPRLYDRFAGLDAADIDAIKNNVVKEIGQIIGGIRKKTSAMILWHSLERPLWPSAGIADNSFRDQDSQFATIHTLNQKIAQMLSEAGNAHCLNIENPLLKLGSANFYDKRLWHMGHMPYSWAGSCAIAQEELKYIRPLLGKVRKCLVLDCDNTLWHGILGEDGYNGIRMDESWPGSCHRELQNTVLELYARGIILALCSKNNTDDVFEVLDKHPDMLLRRNHFTVTKINWQDKAKNICEIAEELNIGIDSLVFMDDNPAEISLVNSALPEVTTIQFSDQVKLHARDLLLSAGLFDNYNISFEDKNRSLIYSQEKKRKEALKNCGELSSFYASLEMCVTLSRANAFSIPRIAQLTQKTNQFNLTTRRYSENDIQEMVDSEGFAVCSLELKDRFGDQGIIAACILQFDHSQAIIDTFLLSCRALGRGVENVFLHHILRLARNRGCKQVIGIYMPTNKNAQVEQFYQKNNFQQAERNDQGTIWSFDFEVDKMAELPEYFTNIDTSKL